MQQNSSTGSRTARDLAVLVSLTILLHAPFVGQAFHLDDVQYLDVALNVPHNPLFPMDLPSVFEGQHLTLWGHTHPPLNAYLIAGLVFLHGGAPSEVFLHSVFLFFPILLTISFYFLARRFAADPLMASALFATNPTLMISAHTLMTEALSRAYFRGSCHCSSKKPASVMPPGARDETGHGVCSRESWSSRGP